MTATHLKRLFASQDVFNTLDRNVAGLTVPEADEKEVKQTESEGSTITTEPPTPARSMLGTCQSVEPSQMVTPMPGICQPVNDPMNMAPIPREDDSDSTISAPQHSSPGRLPESMTDRVESSGIDSDVHDFVSRLPRRSMPAPRYASCQNSAILIELQHSRSRKEISGVYWWPGLRACRRGSCRAAKIIRVRSAGIPKNARARWVGQRQSTTSSSPTAARPNGAGSHSTSRSLQARPAFRWRS